VCEARALSSQRRARISPMCSHPCSCRLGCLLDYFGLTNAFPLGALMCVEAAAALAVCCWATLTAATCRTAHAVSLLLLTAALREKGINVRGSQVYVQKYCPSTATQLQRELRSNSQRNSARHALSERGVGSMARGPTCACPAPV
jgi:hypothetical protein